MRAEVLRDWDAFRALHGEWDRLLRQSAADSIFLTWDWIATWLDSGARRWQPLIVVVRDFDGRLVGIAPFYLAGYSLLRTLPVRVLRIAGDYPTGGEHGDWIVAREHEAAACEVIGAALRREPASWDAIWMPNVSGWDGALDRTRWVTAAGGMQLRTRPVHFGHIDLPASLGEYENSLSANRRQQIRRKRRNLLKESGAELYSPEDAAGLAGMLDDLFSLHHTRWMTRGDPGTFVRKPQEAEFYRRFAPVALANGWLRLHVLRQNGASRAIQYGYCYNGTFLQLQEGFDPGYQADAGNVLRHYAIERCIAEGLKCYDFLGEMTEHKTRWQATRRVGCDIFVVRGGLRTLPLRLLPLWPTGRFLHGQGEFAPRPGAELDAASGETT